MVKLHPGCRTRHQVRSTGIPFPGSLSFARYLTVSLPLDPAIQYLQLLTR
jgi:hypothetical protein